MLRGIGDRQTGSVGEGFDGAIALGDLFEQFKPVLVAESPGNCGKLTVKALFRIVA